MIVKVLDSIEDQKDGMITLDCGEGVRLKIDRRMYELYSTEEILGMHGIQPDRTLLPLFYQGELVGQLPAYFDTSKIRSNSWLYRARKGDIIRDGDRFVASDMLGPGDVLAIVGLYAPLYCSIA